VFPLDQNASVGVIVSRYRKLFGREIILEVFQVTPFLLASKIWQLNTINQNEAKLLFRGHCPLHARRRFIGAMVPEAHLDHEGLGLTKPATFLRLRSRKDPQCLNGVDALDFNLREKTHLKDTDSRTDRRTDGHTTYCGITPLCVASRGKKHMHRAVLSAIDC